MIFSFLFITLSLCSLSLSVPPIYNRISKRGLDIPLLRPNTNYEPPISHRMNDLLNSYYVNHLEVKTGENCDLLIRHFQHQSSLSSPIHYSVEEQKTLAVWKGSLALVADQMNRGLKALQGFQERLKGTLSPYQVSTTHSILEMIDSLQRTICAIPRLMNLISYFRLIHSDPRSDQNREDLTEKMILIQGILSKNDPSFTNGNIYRMKDTIDPVDYSFLSQEERMMVLLPRLYHMLRILYLLGEAREKCDGLISPKSATLLIKIIKNYSNSLFTLGVPLMCYDTQCLNAQDGTSLKRRIYSIRWALNGSSPTCPSNDVHYINRGLKKVEKVASGMVRMALIDLQWVHEMLSNPLARDAINQEHN
ncbi:MAG: hypothetical protein DHS80DRAFT_24488 [Piptocephalis tieghemiana]|nr:MAG: hypothetical protein DHS80DRAFT_24488 [Piptocephalis tieghemiana]